MLHTDPLRLLSVIAGVLLGAGTLGGTADAGTGTRPEPHLVVTAVRAPFATPAPWSPASGPPPFMLPSAAPSRYQPAPSPAAPQPAAPQPGAPFPAAPSPAAPVSQPPGVAVPPPVAPPRAVPSASPASAAPPSSAPARAWPWYDAPRPTGSQRRPGPLLPATGDAGVPVDRDGFDGGQPPSGSPAGAWPLPELPSAGQPGVSARVAADAPAGTLPNALIVSGLAGLIVVATGLFVVARLRRRW